MRRGDRASRQTFAVPPVASRREMSVRIIRSATFLAAASGGFTQAVEIHSPVSRRALPEAGLLPHVCSYRSRSSSLIESTSDRPSVRIADTEIRTSSRALPREWLCPEYAGKHRRERRSESGSSTVFRQLVAMGIMETQNACGQHIRLATASHAREGIPAFRRGEVQRDSCLTCADRTQDARRSGSWSWRGHTSTV